MGALFKLRYLCSHIWSGYPYHCAFDYGPMDYAYYSPMNHAKAAKETISSKAFLPYNFILLPDINFIVLGYCIEQVSIDLTSM